MLWYAHSYHALEVGKEHVLSVTAVGDVGEGAPSAELSITVPTAAVLNRQEPPSVPRSFIQRSGFSSVELTWDPPGDWGTGSEESRRYFLRSGSSVIPFELAGSATSYEITPVPTPNNDWVIAAYTSHGRSGGVRADRV